MVSFPLLEHPQCSELPINSDLLINRSICSIAALFNDEHLSSPNHFSLRNLVFPLIAETGTTNTSRPFRNPLD